MTERRPRVALATSSAIPDLYADERELVPMLRARGVDAEATVWDDPAVDWSRFDVVVIRSTWDYFEKKSAFDAWLARVEAATRLVNSAPLVRWNADKLYLRDLAARGVATLPTVFVDRGARADLAAIVAKERWDRVVLKPSISGGAFRTHRFDAKDAGAHQAHLDEIVGSSAAMVQPFAPEIADEGEWSLLFFEGELRFAVLKVPARGDYRVQEMFGGVFHRVEPEAWMRDRARAVIDACPDEPVYARIDGIRRGHDFLLMEAELIEPYLYFPAAPDEMGRFVEIVERLARRA